MQSPTKSRTITITGMTGDDSVQKVRTSLGNVSGVTTEAVTLGQATICCAYPSSYGLACAAVIAAGFKTTEPGVIPVRLATPLATNTGPAAGRVVAPRDPLPIPTLAGTPAAVEAKPAIPLAV
jgi:copper chaperone CopZ